MVYNIIQIGSKVFSIYLVEFGGGFDGKTWDKLPPKVPWAVIILVLNPLFLKIIKYYIIILSISVFSFSKYIIIQ
jgi:hypothetical protein